MGNYNRIKQKTQLCILLFILIFIISCSSNASSNSSARIPSYYILEKATTYGSSGASGKNVITVEVKNDKVYPKSLSTFHSSSMGYLKECFYTFVEDGTTCWKGSCQGYEYNKEIQKVPFKNDTVTLSCKEVKLPEIYTQIFPIIEDAIQRVNDGKNLGYLYPLKGQEKLPNIYSKKKGCNKIICFEDNYLTYFSIGDRSSETWKITILND